MTDEEMDKIDAAVHRHIMEKDVAVGPTPAL